MKNYKELRSLLVEMGPEDTPFGGDARSAFSHYGVHRIDNPEQLSRLNAFLSAIGEREFLDPNGAVVQMKTKLNMAGYDFDCDVQNGPHLGNKEYPLTRHGGTFGKNTDTPFGDFEKTDGISSGENSYNLNINTEKLPSGMYKIFPVISPTNSSDAE
jgi:hypothetical protein